MGKQLCGFGGVGRCGMGGMKWGMLPRPWTACRRKLLRLPILTDSETGYKRFIWLGRNRGHRRRSRTAEARAPTHMPICAMSPSSHAFAFGTWIPRPAQGLGASLGALRTDPLSRPALAPSLPKLRRAGARADTPRAYGCDRRVCRPAWWRCRNGRGCPG